jgi:cytoskeleton protein RodZ
LNARSPLSFLKQRRRDPVEPAREAAPEPPRETTRDSIGPLLRQTRESFGYDLQRISQVLRIRYVYLEAIEQGNFDRLPGPAYAIGFIRSYSEFLGLDSERIVEFYKRDVEAPGDDSSYYFPEPVSEAKVPGAAVFTVCALIAAVAYGSWYYASESKSSVADLIPDVPDRLKVLLEPKATEVAEVIARATQETRVGAVQEIEAPSVVGEDGATPVPEPVAADSLADAPTVGDDDPVAVVEETSSDALPASAEEPVAQENAPADETTEITVTAEPAEPVGTVEPEAVAEVPDLQAEDEISALIAEMVGEDEPSDPATDATVVETAVPEPAPTDVVDDADAPQPVSEGTQLAEIPAVPGGNSVAAPDLAPEPQVYGEEGDDVRVMLRALQDCWVQVREESGNLILTRVLRPGDVYRVPNRENLTLLAGNAGGLEILVDGRLMPPLGPLGVVRRDISLNVDALLGATANLQ